MAAAPTARAPADAGRRLSPSRRGAALVALQGVAFGTLAVFGKAAYAAGIAMPTLLAWRFGLAALALWAVVAVTRTPLPRRPTVGATIALGACYVGQSAAYFTALHVVPAATTSILLYTFPAIVAIVEGTVLRVRLARGAIAGVALAIAGTALVAGTDLSLHVPPGGIALGLTSAIVYAVYVLLGSRVLRDVPPLASTAVILTTAALGFGIAAIASGAVLPPDPARAWPIFAGMALVGTVIPVLALVVGLPLVGATRASVISTLEPASTVVFAALVLGEAPPLLRLAGGAMVLGAIALVREPLVPP